MGALDANGVYIYDETDPVSPFSDFMNLGQSAQSVVVGDLDARLTDLETDDTGWVLCTLKAGWEHNTATNQAPGVQARRIRNQVYYRGRAAGTLTVGSTTQVVEIPAGLLPPIDTNFKAVGTTAGFIGWCNASNGSGGVLSVHFKSPFVTGATTVDFSGLSYFLD